MTDKPDSAHSEDRPVLVTGAAGFLGSRVVHRLSTEGRQVVATDVVDDERGHALAELPGVSFVPAELRDKDAVSALVDRCDYVVHLAAMRRKASQGGGQTPFEVNVGATYTMLSAAAAHGLKGFVYGSSHLVYGDFADRSHWFSEADATPGPGLSLYAAAKIASEAFVAAFADEFAFDYLCLRFGGIYGPQAAPGSNTSLMTDILSAIDRGDRPVVNWSRDTTHCLIYVEDAARACVAAVDFPVAGRSVNVVNPPRTAEEIYNELVTLYGSDPGLLDWTPGKARFQQVHNDRLVEELRCAPATSMTDGLRSIIDWHREVSASDASQHAASPAL
jgi:UDP-glucose 4-epimerase